MAYVYRNGNEYLLKWRIGSKRNIIEHAKPRKFGKLSNTGRKDNHAD